MSKHPKRSHLRPFIWGFWIIVLTLLGGVAYLVWERVQEGQRAGEAINSLLAEAREKQLEYRQYVRDKTAEPTNRSAASADVDMELVIAGLTQFRGFAQTADAGRYCSELMSEADELRSKAIAAFKDGQPTVAMNFVHRATSLYGQAESLATNHTRFEALYEKFAAEADPKAIQRMEKYPTEENRIIAAAFKDRQALGGDAAERLEQLRSVLSAYPAAVGLALKAEAGAQQRDETRLLKQVLASGDLQKILETIQGGLDRHRLSPRQAVDALWPVMEKQSGSSGQQGVVLRLPLSGTTALSLVYIAGSSPYWMGQYEISRKEFSLISPASLAGQGDKEDPVHGVSWHDALAFCKRLADNWELNIRLPTEAQWEFACRAGTSTPYSFGEGPAGPMHCEKDRWAPRGQYDPNPWGLYDMHGNLMEWCRNPYDPAEPDGPKALRGGCWLFGPELCRSEARYRYLPNLGTEYIGFRVVVER